MQGKIKVQISSKPGYIGYNVYIFREFDSYLLLIGNKPGEEKKIERGSYSNEDEPTFYIRDEEMREVIKAFEMLGIKPDTEAKNEGELKATKFHLEDLRKLLKIKK